MKILKDTDEPFVRPIIHCADHDTVAVVLVDNNLYLFSLLDVTGNQPVISFAICCLGTMILAKKW